MGYGRTDENTYRQVNKIAATGRKAFKYDQQVRTQGGTIAELLDMTNTKIRESAFPGSDFCGIITDVTGSMEESPVKIFGKIAKTISLLTQGGYTKHPAMWFGAVGDHNTDQYPFQGMVNVESDLAIIAPILESFILEGGGGGQKRESYATMAWFMNNRFDLNEWKRGEKGTLIFIGDEGLYDHVTSDEIRQHFGLTSEGQSTKDIFKELLTKYHVYLIRPEDASYRRGTEHGNAIEAQWKSLIGGENILHLPNSDDIAPMCAAIMGYRNAIPLAQIDSDLGTDEFTKEIVLASSSITPAENKDQSRRGPRRLR